MISYILYMQLEFPLNLSSNTVSRNNDPIDTAIINGKLSMEVWLKHLWVCNDWPPAIWPQ